MLGARSMFETAVGSRPKFNTTSTSTTNTATDRIAVRERNSTSRSLDAMVQAWRSRSGDRSAVLLRDLRRSTAGTRRALDKAAGAHEGDVRRELRSLFDVVCHQHGRTTLFHHVAQKAAQSLRGDAIETRERLVEQQDRRVVYERPGDRDALDQPSRQRAHGAIRMVVQAKPGQELVGRSHIVERGPEPEVLAHCELRVELWLVADPADRAAAAFDLCATTLRLNETGEHLEERRLACAVRTEHGEGLPGLNAEGNVVEGPDRTEAVLQALSPQHRSRRRARSIRTV